MKYTAAFAAVGLLIVVAVRGQSSSSSAAAALAAPGKVGVINIRGAIGNTAEGKQASAELQSQFAPRQTELEKLNSQINNLRHPLPPRNTTCTHHKLQR